MSVRLSEHISRCSCSMLYGRRLHRERQKPTQVKHTETVTMTESTNSKFGGTPLVSRMFTLR
jgi:hypothetical protein